MTSRRREKLKACLDKTCIYCGVVPAVVILYPIVAGSLLVLWGAHTTMKTAKRSYQRLRARCTRPYDFRKVWSSASDSSCFIRAESAAESAASSLQSGLLRLPREIRLQIWGLCVANRFVYHPASRAKHHLAPRVGIGRLPEGRELYSNRAPYPSSLPTSVHTRTPPDQSLVKYPGISPDSFNLLSHHSWCYEGVATVNQSLQFSTMTLTGFIRIPLDDTVVDSAKPRKWTGICLILTCRKIYGEVWPLLYAENTFAFNYLEHMLAFRAHVGTSRLNLIRYLHLSIIPSHSSCSKQLGGLVDFEDWQALWRLVDTEMIALRELDLELHVDDRWEWFDEEKHRLGMRFIKGLTDWPDNLKLLQGRLHRARLLCNAGNLVRREDTSPRALLFRNTFLKLGQNLAEMQSLITKDGKVAGRMRRLR